MPTKPLIAIIDDDTSVRMALRSLVRSDGFAAEVFASADEFLTSHDCQSVAGLILDINMPVMNGFDLHRHLRDSGRIVPTIMITGNPTDGERAHAMHEDLFDCLEKPFRDNELLVTLRTMLKAAWGG